MDPQTVHDVVQIDPTLAKLALGGISGIVTALVALWRVTVSQSKEAVQREKQAVETARSDCEKERQEWGQRETRLIQELEQERERTRTAERKWLEEAKARNVELDAFNRVLRSKLSESSRPPKR